jgi:ABC-2 type transport system permease protein
MRKFTFRNMWLVAKREYLERVKTKAFLILTLLTPVLIFAMGIGPSMIMMSKSNGTRHLVVVAPDAELASAVKKTLETPPDETNNPPKDSTKDAKDAKAADNSAASTRQIADIAGLKFTAETSTDLSDSNKAALEASIDKKQIDGFLWLDPAATSQHSIPYFAASTTDFLEIQTIRNAAREALMANEFQKSGINADRLHDLLKPYDLDATNWVQGKAKKAGDIQFWSVFILGFAMYMVTIFYGMNVLRAVIAEKTSRIMEVLLSTVTPSELLGGKIFGVAAVGLTQVLIWFAAGAIAAAPGAFTLSNMIRQANFTILTGVYFAVFFLLGYLLYSSLCAALGSTVNSEQEAQQFQFVVMLPLIFSFFFMLKAARVPNDPIIVGLSFFPLSSPLVMYARVVLGAAPLWQILLSIGILLVSVAAIIWLCARIYRIGVLMYGKKPTLPEIIKWIRYA